MLKCFIPKLISLHTTSALKLHYVMYSKLLEGGGGKYLGGNIQNYGKLSPQMYSHSFRGVIVACYVEEGISSWMKNLIPTMVFLFILKNNLKRF